MTITRAEAQDTAFAEAIDRAASKLGPNVVRVRYEVGTDSTGDPAVFFRVLLTDEASKRERLLEVAQAIQRTIVWEVEPFEQWGVWPYFDYRSSSEQDALNEPAWA